MKKIIFLSLGLVCISITFLNAAFLTVSNNPEKPAQYTTIQAAHDAAIAGDTILVTGSSSTYGGLGITKPLVLIGAGYNKPEGEQSEGSFSMGATSNNIKIIGFVIKGVTFSGSSETAPINITIEKCQFTGGVGFATGNLTWTGSMSNIYIRNCLFINSFFTFNYFIYSNVVIHNNIFDNCEFISGYVTTDLENIIIKNNLFIHQSTNTFTKTSSLVVENNIFDKSEPQGCTNCAFNHNTSYGNANDTIPGPDNIGTGNFIGINPEFEYYPELAYGFDYAYNFNLKASSPLKNAGTDGSDIGIYGGTMPFVVGLNPPIPVMQELTLPENASAVKQGGTLGVSFKATKQ